MLCSYSYVHMVQKKLQVYLISGDGNRLARSADRIFSFSGVSVSILVLPILLLIIRFLGGVFLSGRICSDVIGRPKVEVGTPDVPGCSSSFISISDVCSWTRLVISDGKIKHQ